MRSDWNNNGDRELKNLNRDTRALLILLVFVCLIMLLFFVSYSHGATADIALTVPEQSPAYSLVECKLTEAPPNAIVFWTTNPPLASTQWRQYTEDAFLFTAKPGQAYIIRAMVAIPGGKDAKTTKTEYTKVCKIDANGLPAPSPNPNPNPDNPNPPPIPGPVLTGIALKANEWAKAVPFTNDQPGDVAENRKRELNGVADAFDAASAKVASQLGDVVDFAARFKEIKAANELTLKNDARKTAWKNFSDNLAAYLNTEIKAGRIKTRPQWIAALSGVAVGIRSTL